MHPPVVVNCLGADARLQAAYSNGDSFSEVFPTGSKISAPAEPDISLERISISSPAHLTASYGARELKSVRASGVGVVVLPGRLASAPKGARS